jgi:hypothetical protein
MKILLEEMIALCSINKLMVLDTGNGIGTERIIEHHPVVLLWTSAVATLPG